MKILHTADWHIGKKLHKHDLSQDFDMFITWLCEKLDHHRVDALLISGDVFDLANPSAEARKQYYRALMQLKKCNCTIILTGGNHDSPAMLDAPAEILKELDMHVVGGLPPAIEEVIIPLRNKQGEVELVIGALPFLRDADLRSANDGYTYEDRLQAIRQGIQNTFQKVADISAEKYPATPAIVMGHLFAAGAETSDSERDIQIGNQAAFNALQFGDYFNYIALGHIHKPQKVTAAVPAYYSGSPIALSFSERQDNKRILLLDTNIGWEPESIPVPVFRSLLKISGTLEELEKKLDHIGGHRELSSLIEIELKEENYDAQKILKLDELVTGFNKPGFEIVKHRATFINKLQGAGELYKSRELEDLKPRDIFLELITGHGYEQEIEKEILGAFDQLLEEVQNDEKLKP